jgi:hypothetical protein
MIEALAAVVGVMVLVVGGLFVGARHDGERQAGCRW